MIKQISWASYWIAIGTTLILYYAIICFRYYLSDIKQILAGQGKFSFEKKIKSNSTTLNNPTDSSSQQEPFPLVNQLVEELKIILQDAATKNLQRIEVVYALQLLLKKYSTIKGTSFETIVSNYIINQCSNYCSIHLDEEEVMSLWVN